MNDLLNRFRLEGFDEKGPSTIHDEEAIRFFRTYIAEDEYVIEILQNGLNFDFVSPPCTYSEKNNKSALARLPELRDIISLWEKQGKVIRVASESLVNNPMSVIEQTQSCGKLKLRPVIDCSRYLNDLFKVEKISLDDIQEMEKLIEKDFYFCNWDLSSMYQQVKLNPDVTKYQGFSIPQENGTIFHYQFTVLMFGISIAVYVVTKLLRPVRNFFRALNIRYNVYIDDSQLCAETIELAESQTKFCIQVFKYLGWDINYKKSQLTASQQIVYLGFLIDSRKMMYFYPERKVAEVKTLFNDILGKALSKDPIHLKLLAKLLGKLCAMRLSHGNIVMIFTRKCQHILGKQVYLNGWNSYCKLDILK